MPAFLQSDDDDGEVAGDGLLSGVNANRRRRQYDEVPDMDDVEEEEVSLYELDDATLGNADWVAGDVARALGRYQSRQHCRVGRH